MSDKPDRSLSGPSGATDELEFFDQLAWAVPTAFAGALAAHRFDCDMRTAAYCAALEHIGRVYNLRGIFP